MGALHPEQAALLPAEDLADTSFEEAAQRRNLPSAQTPSAVAAVHSGEMTKQKRKQARNPLWPMSAERLDTWRDRIVQGQVAPLLTRDLPEKPHGRDGYRARLVLSLAVDTLETQHADRMPSYKDAAEVANYFIECLDGPRHVFDTRMDHLARQEEASRLDGRPPGRPPGPTVDTAVRVWTVEALRRLAGLTVFEAINLWDESWQGAKCFGQLAYGETDRDAAEARFRVERARVRGHLQTLARYQPAPPRRRRGRPPTRLPRLQDAVNDYLEDAGEDLENRLPL